MSKHVTHLFVFVCFIGKGRLTKERLKGIDEIMTNKNNDGRQTVVLMYIFAQHLF